MQGYNSWNVYHEFIDEAKMKEAAELMVVTGLVEAGYKYFIIDGTCFVYGHCALAATRHTLRS